MNIEKRLISIWISMLLLVSILIVIDIPLEKSFGITGYTKGATITVDKGGGQDHVTIQGAIDAANTGDTVYVYAGIYNEHITITGKTINLTGAGVDSSIIDTGIALSGIKVESNYNNISGFTLRAANFGIELNRSCFNTIKNCKSTQNIDAGIYLSESCNNTVIDCILTDDLVGIALLFGSHNNTVISNQLTLNDYNGFTLRNGDNNLVLGNLIQDNNQVGFPSNYPGFWVESNNNVISKNTIDNNLATGLYMKNASNNEIYYNNITRNKNGISANVGSSNNDIYNNGFSSNDENGLAIHDGCEGNNITNNDLTDNNALGITDYPAIFVASDGNKLSGNHIDGNEATGIFLRDSANNSIDNNSIASSLYGIYLNNMGDNDIENNTCISNTKNGIYLDSSVNNTLYNNSCSNNPEHGIFLKDSDMNLLAGNDVSYNNVDTVWNFVGVTGFEKNDDEGWKHQGVGDCWERNSPVSGPGAAYEGSNVWGTNLAGKYPDNADFSLYSPEMYVGKGTSVEFWHWYDMENGWDFARLEISRDSGLNWELLHTFTGSSGGWTIENLDLDDFSGDIIIRFRVTSDANLGLAGWYIDNISLTNHDYQDLESDTDDGWTHGGNGDTWERGFPYSGPWASFSGDTVWGTKLFGEYENNGDCSLYSPDFDLDEGTTISFWHWYDIEEGFDSGELEISDDGGISWDSLSSYDGTLDEWELVEVSLGGYSGRAQIRFRLDTDGSETFDGWYIDDISFLGSGGIHLETSNGNTLVNNTCFENGGNGIYLETSVNNNLMDNNCTLNRKNGIYAESSSNNDVLRNSVSDNKGNGVFLKSGTGNNIENNTAVRNADGILLNSSNLNNLKNNSAMNNSEKGIDLEGSEQNVVQDNLCNLNYEGIFLDNSDHNVVSKNRCESNTDNGLYFLNSNSNITENVCNDNGWHGMGIAFFSGSIENNICDGNKNFGIFLQAAVDSEISRNKCVNNEYGLFLGFSSSGNWIHNNTYEKSAKNGTMLYDGCWDNLIENNTLADGHEGFYLYNCNNNTIIYNNIINHTGYGIDIIDSDTHDNRIHHNNFLFNNNSGIQAWDNGINNSWDDGIGEGNFWENYTSLYPLAANDDHVWNKPYNISGPSNSSDRYPLFYAGPGADTDLPRLVGDNTPAQASTGDSFTFSAEFEDNLGIVTVHVLYSYDGINWLDNETMVLSRGGIWSYSITINSDATDLFYRFYLKDMGRNHVLTDITLLGVQDNDPPELISDDTQDSATTSDMFVFSVKLGDNVGIISASAHYSYNGNDFTQKDLIKEMGDTWSTSITVEEDATELYYYIAFSDGINEMETTINTVQVTDNDAPTLMVDNTPLFGTTGDAFTFEVGVADNYGIESVSVYYSHDDKEYQIKELKNDGKGSWKEDIILELNFTDLYYYFKVTDNSNPKNELTTDKVEIPVMDNDPPTARAGEDLQIEQNAKITLDASSSTDNIGIVKFDWNFIYDGVEIDLNGELEEFTFEISGNYYISLNVSDKEGNWAKDYLNITVIDDTKPRADAGDDITTDQHEEVTLSGEDSTDDVQLSSFTWTFVYNNENITLQGEKTGFVFDVAGSYIITLNVTDSGGNWATDEIKINVKDIDKPMANAGDDLTVEEGTTVLLNGSNSTDNVGIVSFVWSFLYDGLERTHYGETVTFRFKIPGDYRITLMATDGAGNSAADTIELDVIEKSLSDDDDEIPDFWNNTVDEDNDGLDDRWEEYYFDGDASPYADSDADGYKNIHEFMKRTDPKKRNVEPPEPESGSGSGDKKASSDDWWTWIMIGGIFLLIIVIILFLIIKSRRSKDSKKTVVPEIEEDLEDSVDDDEIEEDVTDVLSSSFDMDSIEAEFEKLTEIYNNCSEYGMNMSDYESRYQEIDKAVKLGQEDTPESISAFMTELDDAYFSYYEDLKSSTKKLHKTINADFKKAMGSGLDIGHLRSDYEGAIEYFKEGDFFGAMELFTVVKSNLEKSLEDKQSGGTEGIDDEGEVKKTEKRKMDLDSLFDRILPPAGPGNVIKEITDHGDEKETDHISDLSEDVTEHKELVAVEDSNTEKDETDMEEVGVLSPIAEEENSE